MTLEEAKAIYQPKAIYKTGSSLYLENSRDLDYVFYFDNEEQTHGKKFLIVDGASIVFEIGYKPEKMLVYAYLYKLMEKVEGKTIDNSYNIIEHKKEYADYIKRLFPNPNTDKYWYHILATYYILKNKSYTFTSEQLAKIQEVHDNKCISNELKNSLVNYFNNI